jgi:hypothetical protein
MQGANTSYPQFDPPSPLHFRSHLDASTACPRPLTRLEPQKHSWPLPSQHAFIAKRGDSLLDPSEGKISRGAGIQTSLDSHLAAGVRVSGQGPGAAVGHASLQSISPHVDGRSGDRGVDIHSPGPTTLVGRGRLAWGIAFARGSRGEGGGEGATALAVSFAKALTRARLTKHWIPYWTPA